MKFVVMPPRSATMASTFMAFMVSTFNSHGVTTLG